MSMDKNQKLAGEFRERLAEQMWQIKQVEMWLGGLVENQNARYELHNFTMEADGKAALRALSKALIIMQDMNDELQDLETFYD